MLGLLITVTEDIGNEFSVIWEPQEEEVRGVSPWQTVSQWQSY